MKSVVSQGILPWGAANVVLFLHVSELHRGAGRASRIYKSECELDSIQSEMRQERKEKVLGHTLSRGCREAVEGGSFPFQLRAQCIAGCKPQRDRHDIQSWIRDCRFRSRMEGHRTGPKLQKGRLPVVFDPKTPNQWAPLQLPFLYLEKSHRVHWQLSLGQVPT